MAAALPLRVVGGIFAILGFVATVVYAVLVTTPPPVLTIDMASPAWFTALIGYMALQIFFIVPDRRAFCCGCCSGAPGGVFFVLPTVLGVFSGICFAIYGRPDMTVWALVLSVLYGVVSSAFFCPSRVASVQTEADEALSPKADETAPSAGCCSLGCCLRGWNSCNVVLSVVFLIMLFAGSAIQATGPVLYPPRGKFADLTLRTGDKLRIHYQCEGPKNSSFPVFVGDSSASHGLSDMWPLQVNLSAAGRRMCAYDAPNLGYSGRYHAWQNVDKQTYLPEFFDALEADGEGSRFILIGWGGGAGSLYEYSLSKPSRAAGFVFLSVYGDDVLYQFEAQYNSWSQARINEYKAADLAGRVFLFSLIRGLAAPWGLLPVFAPGDPKGYALEERFAEYRWSYNIPSTWTVQWFSLLPEFNEGVNLTSAGVFDRASPALQGLPVLALTPNRTRSAICDQYVADCDKAVASAEFLRADSVRLADVTGSLTVEYCTASDCNLDLPLRKPGFVVDAIMRKWPK